MYTKFKTYIQNIVPLSDTDFDRSMSKFKTITLEKDELFLRQDQTSKQIAFINDGLIRQFYYTEKGDEITACFCTPNGFTTSYKSFILQQPSNIAIQALEKTDLLVLSFSNIQKLYQENIHWQTLGRLLAEKEFITIEQYASILNTETAKEKYIRLLKEQPEIIQKSPLKYIASYLGVTTRTLSRIRKEISGTMSL